MVDPPENIELRRFARPIGVTGIGTTPDGRTERRLTTVTGSFDGVLATGVDADPGAPPAALSYLTLAPLLAKTLAADDRDARPETPSTDRLAPGERPADSESSAHDGAERRVRELLSRDADEAASDSDLRPTDMTVSREPPRKATDEQDTGDDSDRRRGQDGPIDAPDWPADSTVSEPTRTVVKQSTHKAGRADTDPATTSQDDWQVPDPPDARGPDHQAGSTGAQAFTGDGPTTVVHGGRRGAGEPGGTADGRGGPPIPTETGGRKPADDLGRPSLTVTGPSVSGASTATDADSLDEVGGADSSTRATGAHTNESAGDDGVTERTVIQSDGRLNERVFDRLYEEVSRKMRLERDREGR